MIVEAKRDAPADRPLPGADDAMRPLDHQSADAMGPLDQRAGDGVAGSRIDLVALYDAHAARVWRTALALGVERADLDDAVQDVFMVVHRRAEDFAGRSSVTTWIYGITRRVAADYRRRARRAPHVGVAHLDHAGAPCAEQARHDASRELLALVAQLPIEQREVFVLIELEGMTAPEVASLLGAPVNTVSSRLRLARDHLNEIVRAARAADGGPP